MTPEARFRAHEAALQTLRARLPWAVEARTNVTITDADFLAAVDAALAAAAALPPCPGIQIMIENPQHIEHCAGCRDHPESPRGPAAGRDA